MEPTNHPAPHFVPRPESGRRRLRAAHAALAATLGAAIGCAAIEEATPEDAAERPSDAGIEHGAVDDAGGDLREEPTCGDGVRSPVEECERGDLGGQTCLGLGYLDGGLSCTTDCRFDVTGCNGSEELLVGDGEHPGMEVAADRSVHVVYVRDGVRYRRFSAGTFGPEELIRSGSAHWPQAAVSADGTVHVVWEEGTLGHRIWYARRTGGSWSAVAIHEGTRALLPRLAVDSRGRAHIVYWEVLKPDAPNVGWYKRVATGAGGPGESGAAAGVDLAGLIAGWNEARNGDVLVDERDVVHVFAGSLGGMNHWTVSETGAFADAAGLAKPAGMARTGELFDVALGPAGALYAATTGNAEGTAPVYHLRGEGASRVVWPDIGDPHEAVTTAADLVVPGRVYVIFADNDRIGRIAVVDADGSIIGPVPFADAGEQHTDEHLDRFTNVGAGIPGEEGLWLAYQDNRDGRWQIRLRRVTAAFLATRP
jgi:hypothetical protein